MVLEEVNGRVMLTWLLTEGSQSVTTIGNRKDL
jgi:hypothetical protein